MTTFAVDTSCMIAAVCSWHEHHDAASTAISERLSRNERITVAGHALAEAYAVLTRLPAPHRLSPSDAWTLVEANFVRGAKVVALPATAYAKLLRDAARGGVAGGRTYDAIIAACAVRAKATTLLTLNQRDFTPIADQFALVDLSTMQS